MLSLPDVGKQAFKTDLQNIVARCYYDTDAQRGRILCELETVWYTKILMKSDFVRKIRSSANKKKGNEISSRTT